MTGVQTCALPIFLCGSSFGAGLAQFLVQHGEWNGPTILLAPALSVALPFSCWIPSEQRQSVGHLSVIIVQGNRDDIVSAADSKLIAESAPEIVELIEVEDNHRLNSVIDQSNRGRNLRDMVLKLHRESSSTPPTEFIPREPSSGTWTAALLGFHLAWQFPISMCTHRCKFFP